MINYTERLALLMEDIVARVSELSFIDIRDVLVFARSGRSQAEGAFATCHCLTLSASEAGYYFWCDRTSGRLTRRSEWFVTKSPVVSLGPRQVKYMLSFALPRFCDQSLDRSRKERMYPGAAPWMAKLDTVMHELYHIGPDLAGIRHIEREDGTYLANCHGNRFFEEVAAMVHAYLDNRPDPKVYEFLQSDFASLEARFGGGVGTTFRTFPSFPQRYIERLAVQPPCDADTSDPQVEPLRASQAPTRYTQDDLHVRQFTNDPSRRLLCQGGFKAARPVRVLRPHTAPRGSSRLIRYEPERTFARDLRAATSERPRRGPEETVHWTCLGDASRADEAPGPVGRTAELDADDASRAGRVDEPFATDRDADVRGAG